MAAPHVYFSRQMLKAKYKDPKTNEYRDYGCIVFYCPLQITEISSLKKM